MPASKRWRWIETRHWEVQFHGLPARVPWFESDEMPPLELSPGGPGPEFPVIQLYHAVTAYLSDESIPQKDARFVGFAAQIDLGDSFTHEIERGDLIAAMGVMRDMERTGHECGYLEFNKAFLLGRTGDVEGARAAYRRGTELAPDVEMLWAHYARASEAAKDRAEAVRAWFECLRILPKHQQAVQALLRLGELIMANPHGKREEARWYRPAELRAEFEKDLAGHHGNDAMLRAFGGEMLQLGGFDDLALRALDEAVSLDPVDPDGLRLRGVALRAAGRLDEALDSLMQAAISDQNNPWPQYHLAEVHIDRREWDRVGARLNHALQIDPNHEPTLKLNFFNRTGRTEEQKEDDLAAFARERSSWRALLVAADHAWQRGARERAVRLAADASKLAPHERDVFLTYTGMLCEIGEHEWVAALTRPRLNEGEKTPRAWFNYARALDAMGLRDEAISTLARALSELSLSDDERREIDNRLAEWTGCVAEVDVEVEVHPDTDVLRRSVFMVKKGSRNGRLFEAGMGTPNTHVIEIKLDTPRNDFDLLLEQQSAEEPFEPHNLGAFTVSGYDTTRLEDEPVKVVFLYLPDGRIQCAPWQGEHRVRVSWNLVPPPRHESAEA